MTTESIDTATHRHFAVACFNACWELMEKADRSAEDNRAMVSLAYTSRWHWTQVDDRKPVNFSRSEWQVSRALVLAGRAAEALDHARNGLAWIEQHPVIGGFDVAFAHESIARALAVIGEEDKAREHVGLARTFSRQVTSEADRKWLTSQLDSIPLG
jgi:hypothetical protein